MAIPEIGWKKVPINPVMRDDTFTKEEPEDNHQQRCEKVVYDRSVAPVMGRTSAIPHIKSIKAPAHD